MRVWRNVLFKRKSLGFIFYLCIILNIFIITPYSLKGISCTCQCNFTVQSSPAYDTSDNTLSVNTGDPVTIQWNLSISSCSLGSASSMFMGVQEVPDGMTAESSDITKNTGIGTLEGNPTTPATYTLFLSGQAYNSNNSAICCYKNQTITLIVVGPQPVNELTVTQQSTDETTRSKKNNSYDNILKWKAPRLGPSIVAYRIYLDRELQYMVGEIPSKNRKRIKIVHRHVNPSRTHKYFVVSVDEFGNESKAVRGRIKGSRYHCLCQ